MKKRPRVVFAMIEAGGGHKSTALAMSESLKVLSGDTVNIEVLDFSLYVGADKFDAKHKKAWNAMLKHGWLTRIGYYLQDKAGTVARWYIGRWALPFFEKAAEWFYANDPDIFVPTHWLNSAAALYARKKYPHLRFKHFHFLTEPFDSSSVHHWQGADQYLVGSKRVAEQVQHSGVDPSCISIFGYPVRPSFFVLDRSIDIIKKELGCIPGRLTVLMSGGAEGLGRFARLAQKIAASRLPINLIVVCGKNKQLRTALEAQAHAIENVLSEPKIIARGYVTAMNELIAAADVCAIKAGPASTFETLLWRRPIIFYEYIARHEKANIDYIVSQGAGWYTPRFSAFKRVIQSCVATYNTSDDIRKKISPTSFENGALSLSRFIYGALAHAE